MATGLRGTVGKLALKFPQEKDPNKRDESGGGVRGEPCVDLDDIKNDEIIPPGTSGSSNKCSLDRDVRRTLQREVFCKDAAACGRHVTTSVRQQQIWICQRSVDIKLLFHLIFTPSAHTFINFPPLFRCVSTAKDRNSAACNVL